MDKPEAILLLGCAFILIEIGVILLIVGWRTWCIPQDEWDREARMVWEAKRRNDALLGAFRQKDTDNG